MQAVALCNKLDFYYYQNSQLDSISHYVEVIKDFAKKPISLNITICLE